MTSSRLGLALVVGLLVAAAASGQEPARRGARASAGLSLEAALQALQAEGLPVVFSSHLVRDSMRVGSEPRGRTPRAILDELLSPHGLRVKAIGGRLVVVAGDPPRAAPQPPRDVEPAPMPSVRDEIVVTTDQSFGLEDGAAGALTLDLSGTAELPHLADDPFRALSVLPGVARTETSSEISVRGGRNDEVLVVLDGLELLAPYHVQELDNALSIVAPTFLGHVSLSTGGYPAKYGDRMSGVIDMTTLASAGGSRFSLGLGLVFAEAAAAGDFAGDRGRWYSALRAGNYHLPLEAEDREEDPRYWDSLSKLDLMLRPGQTLRLNALVAQDELSLPPEGSAGERYGSRWGNRYLWLTHGAVLGSNLFVESLVSAGRLDRARTGSADTSEARFEVDDERTLDLAGFKNVWSLELRERSSIEAGIELRHLRSTIGYHNDRELAEDPFAPLRPQPPVGTTSFEETLTADQAVAFVSSRLRPSEGLTAELGARYDRNSAAGESYGSPRFNLAWEPSKGHLFRLAWGWFYQSQRPNELQVEDGETRLARAEKSEHRIAGYEHRAGSGAAFRVEAYQRRFSHTRVRFENLFDSITLFPELTEGRVRIAPERGRAQGVELWYRSAEHGPLSWQLSYAFSSIKEDLGDRIVRRGNDQPHALRADLSYRPRDGWDLHAVWLYHTGWPTTRVTGRFVSGPDGTLRVEPVLGPFHGDRLPTYHRLDVRASRTWRLTRGRLTGYLEVQNLYDRKNVRGFDNFAFEAGADGEPHVGFDTVSWGELLPSFGIRWQL
jgi:hypothetical protein